MSVDSRFQDDSYSIIQSSGKRHFIHFYVMKPSLSTHQAHCLDRGFFFLGKTTLTVPNAEVDLQRLCETSDGKVVL
jgi:hypothetical protein